MGMKTQPLKKTKKQISLPNLLKYTQDDFNEYIRLRDQDKGCISCPGMVEHAGDYFSQGHHSALRFNEVNVNGQCLRCNTFLHGNLINYRKGLIKRYGEQKVQLLESSSVRKTKKWERFELQALREYFKNEISKLKN